MKSKTEWRQNSFLTRKLNRNFNRILKCGVVCVLTCMCASVCSFMLAGCSNSGGMTTNGTYDGTSGGIQKSSKHSLTKVESKAPTCTTAGNSVYYTCSHCDKWFEDCSGANVISDHNSVVIAALGHDVIEHAERQATCDEDGWNAYETCSRCDYTTYSEIPALEHAFVNTVCTRCGYKMEASNGLLYALSEDGTYYSVSGIGTATDTKIVVADIYNNLPVKAIADNAFMNCTITSVVLPAGITTIGTSAFAACSELTRINIPETVTSIGAGAFSSCNNLQYNTYDNGCYLGNADNLYYVLIKAQDTYITSCKINESTKHIYGNAFLNCSDLISIEMPEGVMSIGDYAFSNCNSLSSVKMAKSITYIGSGAFAHCYNLTSIEIPEGITKIEDAAFYYCKALTSVTIPDTATYIGNMAFSDCNELTNITIGRGVKSIAIYAFSNCKKLKTVYYKGSEKEWENIEMGERNSQIASATRYYYSESEPTLNDEGTAYDGNWWHYDTDGKTPVIWRKS